MQAWRAVGNAHPGRTTWSADVDGRPVFTAWRERDLGFDKQTRRSTFDSPPDPWAHEGPGKSYIARARQAMNHGWPCRLILLNGPKPWTQVTSADIDERLYAVQFTRVEDDGTLGGTLLTLQEYLLRQSAPEPGSGN